MSRGPGYGLADTIAPAVAEQLARGQVGDRRLSLGERQCFLQMPFEQRDVIALFGHMPIECDMFARVQHFLLDE